MVDQREDAARKFAEEWKDRGYEKGETHSFWLSLLHQVYGVENPEKYIRFEAQVKLDTTSFIDAYIDDTKVMIEQKGIGKSLNQAIRQADGTLLTPFQQAKRYIGGLPRSEHPRWLITCNFAEFWVYDMEQPNNEPEKILLKDLEKEYYRLEFLVDKGNHHLQKEMEVSVKAGELVGEIYDAFARFYKDGMTKEDMSNLNVLCVRLVFCLYAENSGLFGKYAIFHDYMESHTDRMRKALVELFKLLNTDEPQRDKHLREDDPLLASFPYVNGRLFADEDVDIPGFDEDVHKLLLEKASAGFNWSDISPTIFGAVFESTLNPETRRAGGMHYTSIENIHKVIDPLFLDDLKAEFKDICKIDGNKRDKALLAFQAKLGGLCFLDPACGSGNFLTESYISLRRLENSVLRELSSGQISIGGEFSPIKVSLNQFYGIEINDFAVSVAKTALWIAEHQMMKETETIVGTDLNFLPLKSYTNIVKGNALTLDWGEVVSKNKLNYIMGNPPFVGKKEQTKEQKADLVSLYGKEIKGVGNMDYVTGWYIKAAQLMQGTNIKTGFVSTNSITQGEQPSTLWTKLNQYNVNIIFAYRSFEWNSESADKASVYCVIIGFTTFEVNEKRLYIDNRYSIVDNINGYLLDAPAVIIPSRSKPLCDVPAMSYGSMPIDNNNLILNEQDVAELLRENEKNAQFIREYVGGDELMNGKKRWCLWLYEIDPQLYINSKFIMRRIEANRDYRLNGSNRSQTNKAAETPHLFGEIRQPQNGALVIPKVSSEDRRYIPISYVEPGIIINGSALMIPDASLYLFGVLMSNVHNAWMRVVCGRMGIGYQYSAGIVYNNFPWPNPTDGQKRAIEQMAQAVLDAREKHKNVSLANMYKNKNFWLFGDLKTAHDELNRAVMAAYGWNKNHIVYSSESACVAELMKMYLLLLKK